MAASVTSDGPVLNLINKRIRALKKKYNRIIQMEESMSQGKPINKEQEEFLRSKPSITALIDELEKLRQPLSSALEEELTLALTNTTNTNNDVVQDLLNVLYFGSLFDVKSQNDFTSTMLTRTHERGCCLTYDYVTDDATDLLAEKDLDSISALGGLLISRPTDSSLSHQNALQRCVQHAKLWLANADQRIDLNSDVTYAGLRERLNKIMCSEYFITTPEMKATVEVAAAAAGNYGSFQVPLDDSVEVEGSISQSEEKDEGTANFQGHGSGDDQSDRDGELQKDELETENAVEVGSFQQEQTKTLVDVEPNHKDVEVNEQQYYPRRGYQNQRGFRGGRRGYSNGRGRVRGGYQNGRNQYYDQPENYYPRNNYYNNRGRGGRGGGPSFNNHGSGGQGDYVAGHIGVES